MIVSVVSVRKIRQGCWRFLFEEISDKSMRACFICEYLYQLNVQAYCQRTIFNAFILTAKWVKKGQNELWSNF